MITEYRIQSGYRIEKLKDFLYLISEDEWNGVSISESTITAQISNDSAIKVNGKISFTEAQNDSDVYNYTSKAVLSVREGDTVPKIDFLKTLVEKKWYVVLEDVKNTQYLLNPEFPVKTSFKYTFTDAGNGDVPVCEITFDSNGNYPCTKAEGLTYNDAAFDYACTYDAYKVYALEVAQNDMVRYNENLYNDDSTIEYILKSTASAFKTVDFNRESFSYTYSYDGEKYSSAIKFTIPLSEYNFVWHYSLSEFANNRYTALVHLNNGYMLATGRELGLAPDYEITASSDDSTNNYITITLEDISNEKILYAEDEIQSYEVSGITYVPSTQWYEQFIDEEGAVIEKYECISQSQAIWTLAKAVNTATGQETGEYACYYPYRERYANYNIVDTYTAEDELGATMVFECSECMNLGCQFTSAPNTFYRFYESGGTAQTVIEANCDWSFSGLPSYITASVSGGSANIAYNVTFTCSQSPEEEEVIETGTAICGEQEVTMWFAVQKADNWISRTNFSGTAQEWAYTSYYTSPPARVDLLLKSTDNVKRVQINNSSIIVYVGENTDTENHRICTAVLKRRDNGEEVTITINQDKLYTEWVASGTTCSGSSLYEQEIKFKGYFPDNISIDTGERRLGELIETGSTRCQEAIYKWEVVEDEVICEGSTSYYVEKQLVSRDGGQTWEETGQQRRNRVKEYHSPECDETYYWNMIGYVCNDNGDLCTFLAKWHWNGEYEEDTGERMIGEVMYEHSNICISPEDITDYRNALDYQHYKCIGRDMHYAYKREFSTDGGETWFPFIERYINLLGEEDYRQVITYIDDTASIKERECPDCISGDTENQYEIAYAVDSDYWAEGDTFDLGYLPNESVSDTKYAVYQEGSSQIPLQRTARERNFEEYVTPYENPIDAYYFFFKSKNNFSVQDLTDGDTYDRESIGVFTQGCDWVDVYEWIDGVKTLIWSSRAGYTIEYTASQVVTPNAIDFGMDVTRIVSNRHIGGNNYKMTFDSEIEWIGSLTFSGNTALTGIVIPEGITDVWHGAFQGCTNLTDVSLPDSLTGIHDATFRQCTSLESITLPDGLTSMGYDAFRDCTSLTSITLPDSLIAGSNNMFSGCTSLASVTLGNGRNYINDGMFRGCTSLESITIPDGVENIGGNAFQGCTSLSSVTFGNGVQTIWNDAFNGCTSLTSISLPATTENIEWGAFIGCSSLSYIKCLAETAPTIRDNTFMNVATGGTLDVSDCDEYSDWLSDSQYYLGYYDWSCILPPAPSDALCFTALEDGCTVRLRGYGISTPISLEKSRDGIVWSTYTWEYAGNLFGELITLENIGDTVYFRSTDKSYFTSTATRYYNFRISKRVSASGDLTSLLDKNGGDVPSEQTISTFSFTKLFYDCVSLVTAPNLPSTTLSTDCYSQMFYGCTGLTQAPELPATVLADGCYSNMFQNCTSLTTAPELPATVLGKRCYFRMFDGCTSLNQAPALPATVLAEECYANMFYGCTSLTTAPALPATTLVTDCYYGMFEDCASLNYVLCLATNITSSTYLNYTENWLSGASSTGTFTKATNAYWHRSVNGIPIYWTVRQAVINE